MSDATPAGTRFVATSDAADARARVLPILAVSLIFKAISAVAQSRTAFHRMRSTYFNEMSSQDLAGISKDVDAQLDVIEHIYTDVIGDIQTRTKDVLTELAVEAVNHLDDKGLGVIVSAISTPSPSSSPSSSPQHSLPSSSSSSDPVLHTKRELAAATDYYKQCTASKPDATKCEQLRARLRAMLLREIGVLYGTNKVSAAEQALLNKQLVIVGKFFLSSSTIEGLAIDPLNGARTLMNNGATEYPLSDPYLAKVKRQLEDKTAEKMKDIKKEGKESDILNLADFGTTLGDTSVAFSVSGEIAKNWAPTLVTAIGYASQGIDVLVAFAEAVYDVHKMREAYHEANAATITSLRDVGIASERAGVDGTLMTFHVCRVMAHLEEAIKAFLEGLEGQAAKNFGENVLLSSSSLQFKDGKTPDQVQESLGKLYKTKICSMLTSVHMRITALFRTGGLCRTLDTLSWRDDIHPETPDLKRGRGSLYYEHGKLNEDGADKDIFDIHLIAGDKDIPGPILPALSKQFMWIKATTGATSLTSKEQDYKPWYYTQSMKKIDWHQQDMSKGKNNMLLNLKSGTHKSTKTDVPPLQFTITRRSDVKAMRQTTNPYEKMRPITDLTFLALYPSDQVDEYELAPLEACINRGWALVEDSSAITQHIAWNAFSSKAQERVQKANINAGVLDKDPRPPAVVAIIRRSGFTPLIDISIMPFHVYRDGGRIYSNADNTLLDLAKKLTDTYKRTKAQSSEWHIVPGLTGPLPSCRVFTQATVSNAVMPKAGLINWAKVSSKLTRWVSNKFRTECDVLAYTMSPTRAERVDGYATTWERIALPPTFGAMMGEESQREYARPYVWIKRRYVQPWLAKFGDMSALDSKTCPNDNNKLSSSSNAIQIDAVAVEIEAEVFAKELHSGARSSLIGAKQSLADEVLGSPGAWTMQNFGTTSAGEWKESKKEPYTFSFSCLDGVVYFGYQKRLQSLDDKSGRGALVLEPAHTKYPLAEKPRLCNSAAEAVELGNPRAPAPDCIVVYLTDFRLGHKNHDDEDQINKPVGELRLSRTTSTNIAADVEFVTKARDYADKCIGATNFKFYAN